MFEMFTFIVLMLLALPGTCNEILELKKITK